jgi:hypothetical protein
VVNLRLGLLVYFFAYLFSGALGHIAYIVSAYGLQSPFLNYIYINISLTVYYQNTHIFIETRSPCEKLVHVSCANDVECVSTMRYMKHYGGCHYGASIPEAAEVQAAVPFSAHDNLNGDLSKKVGRSGHFCSPDFSPTLFAPLIRADHSDLSFALSLRFLVRRSSLTTILFPR